MSTTIIIGIEFDHVEGRFASKDDLAAAINMLLEGDQIDTDDGGIYTVANTWDYDVDGVDRALKMAAKADAAAAETEMSFLVDAVEAHAAANYESDGWDYIVETFDRETIAKEITAAKATTKAAAIAAIADVAGLLHDREQDIRATAF